MLNRTTPPEHLRFERFRSHKILTFQNVLLRHGNCVPYGKQSCREDRRGSREAQSSKTPVLPDVVRGKAHSRSPARLFQRVFPAGKGHSCFCPEHRVSKRRRKHCAGNRRQHEGRV